MPKPGIHPRYGKPLKNTSHDVIVEIGRIKYVERGDGTIAILHGGYHYPFKGNQELERRIRETIEFKRRGQGRRPV